MNKTSKLTRIITVAAGAGLLISAMPVMAQLPPAATGAPVAQAPGTQAQQQAAKLIGKALDVANANPSTSTVAVHDSAALLPLLAGRQRRALTSRWGKLAQSAAVTRQNRLRAYSAFFDIASRHSSEFANDVALDVPDAAARAGAFVDLSQAVVTKDWYQANHYAELARRAARQEPDLTLRARALTFIAYREASLNPAVREQAVTEASSEVRLIQSPQKRDALLADVVGAAAKFDLPLAKKIAKDITDPQNAKLAEARINLAQLSQTTVADKDQQRMAVLAKAAAPYDIRAVPYLLQLPASSEIFRILGDALPPIYPGAHPSIDPSLLQRMWKYTQGAPKDVYRDQLQSRLARLMVLFDLWRGKEWGDQLAWKGGQQQVAQFVRQVVSARALQLNSEPLRKLAASDTDQAIANANAMSPRNRVAALLLIAGQILNPQSSNGG